MQPDAPGSLRELSSTTETDGADRAPRDRDVAAGALLCTETGVVLTRMDGAAFDVRRAGSLLVGSPAAHAEVLEYLSPDRC